MSVAKVGHRTDRYFDLEDLPDAVDLLLNAKNYYDINRKQLKKDKRAISVIAEEYGFDSNLVQSILEYNEDLTLLEGYDPYTRKRAWIKWIDSQSISFDLISKATIEDEIIS